MARYYCFVKKMNASYIILLIKVHLTSAYRCIDRPVLWYVLLRTDVSCFGTVGRTNDKKWSKMAQKISKNKKID